MTNVKPRRDFSLLVGTSIAALLLGNAAGAQTLTIAMESRLGALDPTISTSHQSRNHGYKIYDTLLAIDADGNVRPQMAEWSASEDGRSYTFSLREGLIWHDGEPVTAEDAVASIERWGRSDRMGRALMEQVEEIRVEGQNEFVVELKNASDLILTAFAKPSGLPLFVVPKRVAELEPGEPIDDYTGSGPFRFIASEFEPGARVVYERFDEYLPRDEPASGLAGGKVANVERIERIEMPDELTKVNALLAGEIDFLEAIPYDLLQMVEGNDGVRVEILDPVGYQNLYRFNQLHPPFDNELVRRAAMYAVDQVSTLQAQIGDADYYQICPSLFGCGLTYEFDTHSDMIINSDVDRARELLEEAGYNDEQVVLLHATDIPTLNATPIVMAQQLRAAGFNVNVQSTDFMTMLSRRSSQAPAEEGGWSIFVTGWHTSEIQDPARSMTVTANGLEAWAGWPDIPAITDANAAYLAAGTENERHEIAQQIHDLVIEKGVSIPLGQLTRPTGVRSNVTGTVSGPVPVFWNLSKE